MASINTFLYAEASEIPVYKELISTNNDKKSSISEGSQF